MSELIRANRPPIEPLYSQSRPSDAIELGQVPIRFNHNGTPYDETAAVTFRFVPEDRLVFACTLEGKPWSFGLALIGDDDQQLILTDRGVTIDAYCAAVGEAHGGIVFAPKQSPITVTPPSTSLSSATFHLFNFPDFSGREDYILITGEPPREGFRRCGRVVLNGGGWTVTIAATGETAGISKALKAQGGYAITHIGRMERQDRSAFSSEQLEELLTCLHYFLSFVLGQWAGIGLPVGFDADGRRAFEQWGLRSVAPVGWTRISSWFDPHHGEWLSEVYPGFVALWTDEIWRQPLQHALYWYLGAGSVNPDTGLILAQAALELLSWNYCVQWRKVVSAAAFKQGKLSAADKMRLLLSSLDIPRALPSDFQALLSLRKSPPDGPGATTDIRNSLVHADVSMKIQNSAYHEAWKLSMWYLDLVLLRLCGHRGEYANRLRPRWIRDVESVPWAGSEPEQRNATDSPP